MYWATTTFRVSKWSDELRRALRAWRDHVTAQHSQVTEVRCYRFNGGTSIVWQEGFEDFHGYQALIDGLTPACDTVMEAVFRHAVPGTQESRIWSDAF